MSPSPHGVSHGEGAHVLSPQAASQVDEEFLQNLEQDLSFVHLLAQHSRRFKVPPEEMQDFSDRVCRICWAEAQRNRGKGTIVIKLQQELDKAREDSKTKLVQCNLNAMKQLDVAKGGSGKPPEDETIFLYEPLQYLTKDQKELVLMIIRDKLRQIFDGTAPMSLLEELRRNSGLDLSKLTGMLGKDERRRRTSDGTEEDEDEEDAWERADRAEEKASAARQVADEAKRRSAQLMQDLQRARAEAEEARASLEQARIDMEQAITEAYAEARTEMATSANAESDTAQAAAESNKLRLQLEAALEVLRELGMEPHDIAELLTAASDGKLVGLDMSGRKSIRETLNLHSPPNFPLSKSDGRDAHERYDVHIMNAPSQSTPEDAFRMFRDLGIQGQPSITQSNEQGELRCSFAHLHEARQAASKLQGSMMTCSKTGQSQAIDVKLMEGVSPNKKLINSAAQEVQTDMKGMDCNKVDESREENRKLRAALDELQTKLREMMEKCKEKGIGVEVLDIAKSVGLKDAFNRRSCFERLYQDAFRRIERLEELRKRVHAERAGLLGGNVSDEELRPPLMSCVEQSPLLALNRFLVPASRDEAREQPVQYAQVSKQEARPCAAPAGADSSTYATMKRQRQEVSAYGGMRRHVQEVSTKGASNLPHSRPERLPQIPNRLTTLHQHPSLPELAVSSVTTRHPVLQTGFARRTLSLPYLQRR
eukprot:TRINITY_DN49725_c0_g1_i1.p1 TRINITY_DN49725_c0_g1~~TRINITY_DN49725_c0_g1_i1.p1  ORF type:complete len:709 (-),score=167.99 TRINITY_DN49725_c0_g1_i1:111-2237(-)